jgi:hypothetical protein
MAGLMIAANVLTISAANDGGSGYSFSAAWAAGEKWENRWKQGVWGSGDPKLAGNAARHLTWQALLTVRNGWTQAAIIGMIHELDAESLDSLMDKEHNLIGIKIGLDVMKKLQLNPKYATLIKWGTYDPGLGHPATYISNADDEEVKTIIKQIIDAEVNNAILNGTYGEVYLAFTDPRLPTLKGWRPGLPNED